MITINIFSIFMIMIFLEPEIQNSIWKSTENLCQEVWEFVIYTILSDQILVTIIRYLTLYFQMSKNSYIYKFLDIIYDDVDLYYGIIYWDCGQWFKLFYWKSSFKVVIQLLILKLMTII